MSRSSTRNRPVWIIPLVMLILAILACDEPYAPPPMIDRVEADADRPGRVYIRVTHIGLDYSNSGEGEQRVYESDDYGAEWRRSVYVFEGEANADAYALRFESETLYLNEQAIWTFPRSIFRGFFYDSSSEPSYEQFELGYGKIPNSAQDDTVYIGLGTEGVLVGRLSEQGLMDWAIHSKGIDSLSPLRLTITDPSVILRVVVLALFIPPFALIHAFLLQRVWVYLLPAEAAKRLALKVTAGLVVLAIVGIVVWLTDVRTDLYPIIGVLTAIAALVAVGVTLRLIGQSAEPISGGTRRRLLVACILLSLIVPGGVAAIFALWWLVFGLVFSYWAYQRLYWTYLKQGDEGMMSRIQRWRVDRWALEMIAAPFVALLGTYILTIVLPSVTRLRILPTELAFLGVAAIAVYGMMRVYGRRVVVPRLRQQLDTHSGEGAALDAKAVVWRVVLSSYGWIVLAGIATIATLFGQAYAYSWFTTLLQ